MNFIIAISILISSLNRTNEPIMDGKCFIWERGESAMYWSSSSRIWFCNDTIRMIDMPEDVAGNMAYYVGTYHINSENKTIECHNPKQFLFSLNIGKVISYTDNSKETIAINFSENHELQREVPNYAIDNLPDGDMKIKSSVITYKTTDCQRDCGYFLDNFEDESKLDYFQKRQ
ncbi:MAG: hypothetical protein IT258_13605 [Saprospiraceae bacterium]|nr:hypothetical protein [Saprospiraceae bacterium]